MFYEDNRFTESNNLKLIGACPRKQVLSENQLPPAWSGFPKPRDAASPSTRKKHSAHS